MDDYADEFSTLANFAQRSLQLNAHNSELEVYSWS